MKKIIAAAALAMSGLFIGTPLAQADVYGYIYDLEHDSRADFSGSKNTAIRTGYQVCTDLDTGYSVSAIIGALVTRLDFDYIAAQELVIAAATNLC